MYLSAGELVKAVDSKNQVTLIMLDMLTWRRSSFCTM